MQIEVKVPPLPESVADATVLTWHHNPGSSLERDDKLVDIETDKVVLEVAVPERGWLSRVLRAAGETVKTGDVLALVDTEGALPAIASAPPALPPQGNRPQAGPAARRLLAEHGVDPAQVSASGPGGRVTKGDILAHLVRAPESAPTPLPVEEPPPFDLPEDIVSLGERPVQRVPMTRLRRRVAERLVQAQHTAALLTTFNEVNMKAVIDLRNRYQDGFEKAHGTRLGFMGFFVKAVVHALQRFPIVNAAVEGDDIVYHGYYDIGIAVASPRGLVVPILRDCDQLTLAAVEKGITELAKKARDGKLSVDELSGGTFSITNGGVFGSLLSTPILNPPQSAILGMHKIQERPVAENDQVVIRPMMYLALSYDHRIIDGADAVQFVVAIKEAVEDPQRLLLDL
jgi:2-oxoglutarate dehydrogenase E2 component (dihydrolipoamide succinyltransferase)